MRRNSVQTAHLESTMLKRIRMENGISRADLARDLGLSGSTAGVYVERLMDAGFLTESAKISTDAGRPPKLLQLNPNGGEFIGVDFEARNILAVAINFADKPLRHARGQIEEGDSVNVIVGKIQQAVLEVSPRDPARLLAIGIGVPGIVDATRGIAVRYEYIPQWKDVPLVARLGRRFHVPIFLENTMRAMALAELWFGQGRGCSDFASICVRSGIGAGIVSGDRLHQGGHHSAGELGRWPCLAGSAESTIRHGQNCPELQDIASARSIQKVLQESIAAGKRSSLRELGHPPSMEDILLAAQRKDPLTLQVIGQAANALGSVLGILALAVDPLKFVLAGQLIPLGEIFLKPLKDSVARTMGPSGLEIPEIVNSNLGEHIGALGAAALALHEWKPQRDPAAAD